MAYYTGKDVKVWVTTEYSAGGIVIDASGDLTVDNNSGDTSPATTNGCQEVYPYDNMGGYTGFNLSDVIGVDLSVGATDEEISYFGTKTPGKIETKKDLSVTVTRKKSDRLWAIIAQGTTAAGHTSGDGKHGGRWGVDGSGNIADGTTDPKGTLKGTDVCYGYRVYIQMKADSTGSANDGAVLVLRNCTMGEYSTTLSNDAANEESFAFNSSVEPLLLTGAISANMFVGGNTATPAADM